MKHMKSMKLFFVSCFFSLSFPRRRKSIFFSFLFSFFFFLLLLITDYCLLITDYYLFSAVSISSISRPHRCWSINLAP